MPTDKYVPREILMALILAVSVIAVLVFLVVGLAVLSRQLPDPQATIDSLRATLGALEFHLQLTEVARTPIP